MEFTLSLINKLKKPELWQRSELPFWNDEHISKGMLEAHLSPDTDAASRKPETIDNTVKWLSQVIPEKARLLDLGCGPGLYTKKLSALGYEVTGMDFSKRSIDYAKEHDALTGYVFKDYLEMDYCGEFDAVIMIYCDYSALTAPERKKILSNIKKALKPNGIFIFDVFSQSHFIGKSEYASWYTDNAGGSFWNEKPHICLEAEYEYENHTVFADKSVVITDSGVCEYIIWDTAYTEERLKNELAASGFEVKSIFGDTCGKEYADGDDLICTISSPREV